MPTLDHAGFYAGVVLHYSRFPLDYLTAAATAVSRVQRCADWTV